MIYFCADDYGLSDISSKRILQCVNNGILNKVSVFPNFNKVDLSELLEKQGLMLSLHLNLVEGKALSKPSEIPLLTEKNGDFKYTFGGLLKLSIVHKRRFEEQVYKEIKTQVLFWKNALPFNTPFCVDSHQHTHMIPAVFKTLIKVLREENIDVKYLRIPTEPLLPFIKTPSLYFTYSTINIIKQWLLKVLWFFNKKYLKDLSLPTAKFFGILFSGKMDEARVLKILPKYISLAKKDNSDIEVLFHPGYLDQNNLQNENIVFENFYLSQDRKTEFDSVMKISERSVM